MTIDQLAEMKVEIALDDFGIGTSGLHMLLMVDPDYVKIDRTFISDIANDTRKQAIVAKLCGLAHSLGFLTVAEGVETGSDFRMARDLGCDLAQGYGIARPTTEIRDLSLAYSSALRTVGERRMAPRVCELLSPIEPLSAEGHRLLGRARVELGQFDEAIEAYQRAIVIDDRDVWSMNNLGLLYIQRGQSEEALLPLARAVELRGNSPVFQNHLGTALEQTGHVPEAKEAYEAAVAADSGYAKAVSSLARVTPLVQPGETGTIDLAEASRLAGVA